MKFIETIFKCQIVLLSFATKLRNIHKLKIFLLKRIKRYSKMKKYLSYMFK